MRPWPQPFQHPRGWLGLWVFFLLACAEPQATALLPPPTSATPSTPEPEPEPEPAPAPAPPKAERLELSFVGDIVLGRYRIEHDKWRYREMAAPEANPFAEVVDLLRADVVVGNLESPLIRALPEQAPIKHRNRFGAGAEHVEQLVRGGFSVLSLANNHYYDLGVEGQREGPQLLAEAGLMAVGASREQQPLVRVETLETQGWRVGFIAISTVQNHGGKRSGPRLPLISLSKLGEQVLPVVEAARADHDLLVVSIHWGEEYAAEIRTTQRLAAHKLLDAGVDLLIGHHPHVLQAIERHASGEQRDGLIAYSLGNFLFPRNDGGAEMSAILSTTYVDQGEGQRPCLSQARVDPIYMSRQPSWRPVPAPHYQRAKVHKRLRELSKARRTKLHPAHAAEPDHAEPDHALYVTQLRACTAQDEQTASSSSASAREAATAE